MMQDCTVCNQETTLYGDDDNNGDVCVAFVVVFCLLQCMTDVGSYSGRVGR